MKPAPYMTPWVRIRVLREWAKEPDVRPRRQIGPEHNVSVGFCGGDGLEHGRTTNPDHEIPISRVALYKRNNYRRSEV